MKKIIFEKVYLEKKEKKKIAVCAILILLCGLIAIGFTLLLFLKMNETNIDLFSVAFICTYIGIAVIVCPSAFIFSRTMKRAKSDHNSKILQRCGMLKSKKGFTLVELCVVMAVAAIVGTMVVTFMIFMSNQQAEITKETKCIEEITEVQKTVNGWLKKFDSEKYIISTSPDNNLVATITGTNTPAGNISFSNKKITVDNVETAKEFENITSVKFYVLDGKNAIKVTVKYGKNETQDLIFSLFSKTTRNRRVENRS